MSVDPIMQYGRVRRLSNRYVYGIETQLRRIKTNEECLNSEQDELNYHHYTLKNDWEFVAVLLTRLRRCLVMLQELSPALKIDPNFMVEFDAQIPELKSLRDFEEHFDDYSFGRGRNKNAAWGHLETYEFGSELFSNGVGTVSANAARAAAHSAWSAVLSLEEQARKLGFLSWDDRYGSAKAEGVNQ